MTDITTCPSCGSQRIRLVRRKWKGTCDGKTYTVENLRFHECPDCGEKVYSPEAMRKIEASSPGFAKSDSLPTLPY